MASNTIPCPVCGSVMNSYQEVCSDCGYEIHLLPDDAPKAVIDREQQRAQLAKNLREEKEKLNQELSAKQTEIANLNEQIATISAQAEQAKDEAVRQAQAQTNVKEPVAYLVVNLVVKDRNTIVDLYGLDEGENTFGCLRTEGTHHQVLYGDFMDRHFAIRVNIATNDRGKKRATFTILPIEGQVCMAPNGANLITCETTIEINAVVYVGDVSFTLVENKNFK